VGCVWGLSSKTLFSQENTIFFLGYPFSPPFPGVSNEAEGCFPAFPSSAFSSKVPLSFPLDHVLARFFFSPIGVDTNCIYFLFPSLHSIFCSRYKRPSWAKGALFLVPFVPVGRTYIFCRPLFVPSCSLFPLMINDPWSLAGQFSLVCFFFCKVIAGTRNPPFPSSFFFFFFPKLFLGRLFSLSLLFFSFLLIPF